MWVSGSLIRSSTWRSSSVSAPCISSSICLPSSLARSRTMRGSFCQALPIGCIRVFMTPSCNSAVTVESRCSGTLNSVSSWRRLISSNWLRVSTSSETIVIRCSRVSTLTRIDWLATLSPSGIVDLGARPSWPWRAWLRQAWLRQASASQAWLRRRLASAVGAAAAGTTDGAATSIAVSWKARSSSSSDTSPGRKARSRVSAPRSRPPPRVRGAAGAASTAGSPADPSIAAMPRSTICCNSSIRSLSSPSGSDSVASSLPRMSLMRSMVVRISVTASPVTGMPSRNLPISVSAACASASSRGSPRKPQVPLMVWTRRKMLSRIFALFGSCSNRTS